MITHDDEVGLDRGPERWREKREKDKREKRKEKRKSEKRVGISVDFPASTSTPSKKKLFLSLSLSLSLSYLVVTRCTRSISATRSPMRVSTLRSTTCPPSGPSMTRPNCDSFCSSSEVEEIEEVAAPRRCLEEKVEKKR